MGVPPGLDSTICNKYSTDCVYFASIAVYDEARKKEEEKLMKKFWTNYRSIIFMLIGIVGGCILGAIFPKTATSAGATVLKPL